MCRPASFIVCDNGKRSEPNAPRLLCRQTGALRMTLTAYRLAVEEQVFGNFDVSESTAAAVCKKRARSVKIRHRRDVAPVTAAAEIARMEHLTPLPFDWKPEE